MVYRIGMNVICKALNRIWRLAAALCRDVEFFDSLNLMFLYLFIVKPTAVRSKLQVLTITRIIYICKW